MLLLAGENGVLGTLEKTSSELRDEGLKLVGDASLEEEEDDDKESGDVEVGAQLLDAE